MYAKFDDEARALGAVSVGTCYVRVPAYPRFRHQKFSRHYFNADGLEVAYLHHDLVDSAGLQKLEAPRRWDDGFLAMLRDREEL